MKKAKTILLSTLLLLGAVAEAQENDLETIVSADVVNQYVWRG